MADLKLGIIGCGNMGSAILEGMVRKHVTHADSIIINDKDVTAAEMVSGLIGCRTGDIASVVAGSDYVLIAVKPQDSRTVLESVKEYINGQTVISIMAGVRIATIEKVLEKEEGVSVARAMPNMAAQVGESATCVSFNEAAVRRDGVKKILSSIGPVTEVEESVLDAVTAVAGSGPAYFFYIAENMIKAAQKVGLDHSTAVSIVVQTMYGASLLVREELLQDTAMDMEGLVKRVASKGGTTEAALKVFEDKDVPEIVIKAIAMAEQRSKELSEQ